jgi:hypothetical protein
VVTETKNLAIKSFTIGGRVEYAEILAGYGEFLTPANSDAQIGTVKVGGDCIASDLVAGVTPGSNGLFGDSDDESISAGDSPNIFSKITSITIGGYVRGDPGTNRTFGFAAQQIGTFKVGGTAIALTSGRSNDLFVLGAARPVGASLSTTNADGFAVHVFEV